MPRQWFYAVARGRRVGVFNSWTDCSAQTKGFSDAVFRKFATEAEAQAFIQDFNQTSANLPLQSVNQALPLVQVNDSVQTTEVIVATCVEKQQGNEVKCGMLWSPPGRFSCTILEAFQFPRELTGLQANFIAIAFAVFLCNEPNRTYHILTQDSQAANIVNEARLPQKECPLNLNLPNIFQGLQSFFASMNGIIFISTLPLRAPQYMQDLHYLQGNMKDVYRSAVEFTQFCRDNLPSYQSQIFSQTYNPAHQAQILTSTSDSART